MRWNYKRFRLGEKLNSSIASHRVIINILVLKSGTRAKGRGTGREEAAPHTYVIGHLRKGAVKDSEGGTHLKDWNMRSRGKCE